VSDEILVCPECDCPQIERRTGAPDGPESEGEWRCRCGADFDEPVNRAPQNNRSVSRGPAQELVEMDPDDLVTDGGYVDELPHVANCRHCDWRDTYEGTEWKFAERQAKEAAGGHRTSHPDHVVDVYPAAHPAPDQVHYGSSQNAGRTLHFGPDCERLRADQVSHAPAANPPRGSICDHCGRGLDRHDLLEADQSDRPVATDGGSDVCSDANHHHVPTSVGGDQVLLPIARDHVPVDAVTIHTIGEFGDPDDVDDLVYTLEQMLGHPTEIRDPVASIADGYLAACREFRDDFSAGNRLWVNVAGIEDARGIAYVMAANTLQNEHPDRRTDIRIYTVDDDGGPVMLPTVPAGEPTDVGENILAWLTENEPPESVSELARLMANGDFDRTFRSKIQYNVAELEKDGFVAREDGGYRKRPELTETGRLWVATHLEEADCTELQDNRSVHTETQQEGSR